MKTVAIIAEYNPFHNGHAYQIKEARRITGADFVIVIMSGDFVQRGEPAVMDKYLRAQSALLGGADIVFELPVHYAASGAEYFSSGAIKLLNKIGFIDYLCFGSESGDLAALKRLADFLCNEPEEYSLLLKQQLKLGLSYPTARVSAMKSYIMNPEAGSELTINDLKLLEEPNNILAIEYLKALQRQNSAIIPITIKRTGSSYHSCELTPVPSASALRNNLCRISSDMSKGQNNSISVIESLRECMPSEIYDLIIRSYKSTWPIFPDALSSMLLYRLSFETGETLSGYRDVGIELANRIMGLKNQCCSFSEFACYLKSKKYTAVRIMRALLHIVLGDRESDTIKYHFPDYSPYIRLLGFKKPATVLLRDLNDRLPGFVITKLADAGKILAPEDQSMFDHDLNAHRLYNQLIYSSYGTVIKPETMLAGPFHYD